MTEPAYHLIDHGPQDPAAQLLATVLEEPGAEIAPLSPGQVPRPDETVWFTSQQGFLEAAAGSHLCEYFGLLLLELLVEILQGLVLGRRSLIDTLLF